MGVGDLQSERPILLKMCPKRGPKQFSGDTADTTALQSWSWKPFYNRRTCCIQPFHCCTWKTIRIVCQSTSWPGVASFAEAACPLSWCGKQRTTCLLGHPQRPISRTGAWVPWLDSSDSARITINWKMRQKSARVGQHSDSNHNLLTMRYYIWEFTMYGFYLSLGAMGHLVPARVSWISCGCTWRERSKFKVR